MAVQLNHRVRAVAKEARRFHTLLQKARSGVTQTVSFASRRAGKARPSGLARYTCTRYGFKFDPPGPRSEIGGFPASGPLEGRKNAYSLGYIISLQRV